MRKFRFIYVLMAASFFVACAESDDLYENETNPVAKNPYEISIETAMQTLETMFPEMMRTTRVSASEVKTLRRSDLGMTTRSEDEDPQAPVAYIIPLANNGCAIMGADTRKERLYAALESTTLTPDDIARAVQQQQSTRAENTNGSEGADGEFEQIDDIKKFASGLIADAITRNIQIPDTLPSIVFPGEIYDTILDTTITYLPILTTKWSQRKPFNGHLGFNPEDSTENVVGCGPIAIAQILHHSQKPNSLNNHTINWNSINTLRYNISGYVEHISYHPEVATFIKDLRDYMGLDDTDASIKTDTAAMTLKNLLYTNETRTAVFNILYETTIRSMLQRSYPIYMRGSRPNGVDKYGNPVYKGHAWVVDGLKQHKYIVTRYGIQINVIDKYYTHCNFGWKGDCDGYYLIGNFDLTSSLSSDMVEEELGDKISQREGVFYRYNLQMIACTESSQ